MSKMSERKQILIERLKKKVETNAYNKLYSVSISPDVNEIHKNLIYSCMQDLIDVKTISMFKMDDIYMKKGYIYNTIVLATQMMIHPSFDDFWIIFHFTNKKYQINHYNFAVEYINMVVEKNNKYNIDEEHLDVLTTYNQNSIRIKFQNNYRYMIFWDDLTFKDS